MERLVLHNLVVFRQIIVLILQRQVMSLHIVEAIPNLIKVGTLHRNNLGMVFLHFRISVFPSV